MLVPIATTKPFFDSTGWPWWAHALIGLGGYFLFVLGCLLLGRFIETHTSYLCFHTMPASEFNLTEAERRSIVEATKDIKTKARQHLQHSLQAIRGMTEKSNPLVISDGLEGLVQECEMYKMDNRM